MADQMPWEKYAQQAPAQAPAAGGDEGPWAKYGGQQAQQGTTSPPTVSNPASAGPQPAQPAPQAAPQPSEAPHTPWGPEGSTLRTIQHFLATREGGFSSPVLNQLAHGTGLAAGMLGKGVTSTAGVLADAGAGAANLAGANLPMPSQQLASQFPQPQGTAENIADFAGTMAAGGMADPLARALQAHYAPSAAQARAPAASPRQQTLIDARAQDYRVPPSQGRGSVIGSVLEGLAGKENVAKDAQIHNQGITNQVATRAAGLPAGTGLTRDTIDAASKAAYEQGYKPLEDAGTMTNGGVYRRALDAILARHGNVNASFPGAEHPDVADIVQNYRVPQYDAGDAVEAIKNLRRDAGSAYRGNNAALGGAQNGIASALEDSIGLNLNARGEDGGAMLDQFRNARQLIAKQKAVAQAVVEGTGDVSAPKIAAQLQSGKPLTDGLQTIGQFASAFPSAAAMPHAESVVSHSPLGYAGWGGAGALAGLLGGVPGAAGVAAMPALRAMLRKGLLSNTGQKMFVDPKLQQGLLAQFLQNPAMQRAYPAMLSNLFNGQQQPPQPEPQQ